MQKREQESSSRTQAQFWDELASLTWLLPEQVTGVQARNARRYKNLRKPLVLR